MEYIQYVQKGDWGMCSLPFLNIKEPNYLELVSGEFFSVTL